jgi:hypothetical protein
VVKPGTQVFAEIRIGRYKSPHAYFKYKSKYECYRYKE